MTACSCLPFFRKNVIATCKIVSFLCSLDNFLLKNTIVYIFGIHILKWRPFEKKGYFRPIFTFFSHQGNSLNSRDLFLNLRRLVKMTKPLRFENKSLRLKYKCLICIWIIFWAILDLFINPKYLFQNKSFSQTYYFKSEKSFVILTSLLGLKINPGNLERKTEKFFSSQHISYLHKNTYLAHPFDFFNLSNLSCIVSLWCASWCGFLFASFWSNQ